MSDDNILSQAKNWFHNENFGVLKVVEKSFGTHEVKFCKMCSI